MVRVRSRGGNWEGFELGRKVQPRKIGCPSGSREESRIDLNLTTDKDARKEIPIGSGVLDYFPDAIAAVAHVSYVGNQQHNPGQPLHWERSKSTDHADCIIRHFLERGTVDTDGTRHSAKMAWRALALLQLEIEDYNAQQKNTNSR